MKMRDLFGLQEGNRHPPLELSDYENIRKWKEQGLSWPVIAYRLNRVGAENSLQVQWNRFKKGAWKNHAQKVADRNAEIEREIAAEPNLAAIARRKGLSPDAYYQRALRLGLDQEMRMELSGKRRTRHGYADAGMHAESAIAEKVEEWGVYQNGPEPRTSVEVYRGPKAWCLQWMKDHRRDCPPGTWHVARSIAMTNRIKLRLGIKEDAFDDEEGAEEQNFEYLPPIAGIKALRPQLAAAAQKQYDEWEQDEDGYNEELGHGGICHLIADDMCGILSNAGYNVWTQTASDVQHVTCIVQCRDGIVDVDVPYGIYERGSMFTWTKLPGVTFTPDDVVIYRLDPDPANIEMYVED